MARTKSARAQKREIERWAERERERARRAKAREVRARLRAATKKVRGQCRAARARLREAIRAYRLAERVRIQEQINAWRAEARGRCQARIRKVRDMGLNQRARERAERLHRRELQRELEAVTPRAAELRDKRAKARERASESDDAVRANLPPELIPVFERVRRRIRATPKLDRTEAFLQWAHDNPEVVAEIQIEESDAATARMIRELQEEEARAYRERTGSDDDPPF